MAEEGKLLNLAAMARRAGVSRQWLRQEAKAGRIPFLQAGRAVLFNPHTIMAILAARAAGTVEQQLFATLAPP